MPPPPLPLPLPLPREDSAASGCYRTRDREEHQRNIPVVLLSNEPVTDAILVIGGLLTSQR